MHAMSLLVKYCDKISLLNCDYENSFLLGGGECQLQYSTQNDFRFHINSIIDIRHFFEIAFNRIC